MNLAIPSTPTTKPYRFDHPRISDVINDMYIPKSDLSPGDPISFDLPTTEGGLLRSADLAAKGQPVLLVFGSNTCPVTEGAADGLKQLHARFGHQVRFVMIQVREAHPGATIPQPQTFAQKLRHAIQLKNHHQLPFEVAVDDIDGSFHQRLGARPNSAYLVDPTGTIIFRAQWANETQAIGEALSALVTGKTPAHPAVTRTFHSVSQMLGYMKPVLDAAGKGAWLDTLKIAPPLGVMMTLSELFFFLPRPQRGLPTMLLTALLGVALLAGGLTLLF